MTSTTWVRRFDQLSEVEQATAGGWDAIRGLLGGKGANLAEMTRLGVPVPPGFTITTQACLHYLGDDHGLPIDMWDQVVAALRSVAPLAPRNLRVILPAQAAERRLGLRRR